MVQNKSINSRLSLLKNWGFVEQNLPVLFTRPFFFLFKCQRRKSGLATPDYKLTRIFLTSIQLGVHHYLVSDGRAKHVSISVASAKMIFLPESNSGKYTILWSFPLSDILCKKSKEIITISINICSYLFHNTTVGLTIMTRERLRLGYHSTQEGTPYCGNFCTV